MFFGQTPTCSNSHVVYQTRNFFVKKKKIYKYIIRCFIITKSIVKLILCSVTLVDWLVTKLLFKFLYPFIGTTIWATRQTCEHKFCCKTNAIQLFTCTETHCLLSIFAAYSFLSVIFRNMPSNCNGINSINRLVCCEKKHLQFSQCICKFNKLKWNQRVEDSIIT